MRNPTRKVAYVGEVPHQMSEALKEYGYQAESVSGETFVGLARELYRVRPSVVHARNNHLKAAAVSKLMGILLVIHAGRGTRAPAPRALLAWQSGPSARARR